jgi:DNA end-binding protein Ku
VARAVWKGTIRFGEAAVPVKLYSAVTDRRIHFRLLHEEDLVPVEQRLVDPRTGEVVPRAEIRRGYRLDEGTMVVLTNDELDALQPASSRTIEVRRFVEPARIDHRWYDRPYWLGPDGDDSAYAALAQALRDLGYEGVARWVMRKHTYVGALRAERGRLARITLGWAVGVVGGSALGAPAGRAPSEQGGVRARRHGDALSGEWAPAEWADEHRERVLELVEAKREGRTIRLEDYRSKPTGEADPREALAASLDAARGAGSVA